MNKSPICFGAGLIALDVILNGSPFTLPKLSAGGSCGNVLSILSYLGWNSYPIARLANDRAGVELINDLERWNINTSHISLDKNGSTPIIIHRILKNKMGEPVHRFEFRDPHTKSWLPQFKGITKSCATEVTNQNLTPEVFYFDRMNPGTLELATYLKTKGSIIFFEPSSIKDEKQFEKFLKVADIVKFSNERIPEFKEKYSSSQCFLEIETLGKDGLLYRCKASSGPNEWKAIGSYHLDKVRDTAGAGDWCSSGIISMLCSQGITGLLQTTILQVEKALSFGQALGALNCLYDGARGLMYYHTHDIFIWLVTHFTSEKEILSLNLSNEPLIDISTQLEFSDLYQSM